MSRYPREKPDARAYLVEEMRRQFIEPEAEPLDPLEAGIGRAIENRTGANIPGTHPEETQHDRVMAWIRAENAAAARKAAQDAAETPEHDPGPVAPLNGRQLLNGAASALGAPPGSVTVNTAGSAAELLRWHIANQ